MISLPGFKFKLEPFLNLKTQIEKNRKLEFGQAVMKHEKEKEILSIKINHMEDSINNAIDNANKGVPVYVLKNYSNYISKLNDDINLQNEVVIRAGEAVDLSRKKLYKAMQERKVMENLKNRQKEEYRKEELKQEQKTIDEVVSYKFSVVGD